MELMGQILIKLNTSAVVSYINQETDKRSRNSLEESIWLFLWAELHLAFVRVFHFPDLHSMLADYFNRLGCSFGKAWSLNRYIIHCSKTKVQISSEQTPAIRRISKGKDKFVTGSQKSRPSITVAKHQTFRRYFMKV